MVFQSYALYPHMTVYDNIAFPLKAQKVAEARAAAEGRVGGVASSASSMLLKRKPRQLSGGQRQRVALARALVREPNVFLLDEPLSNLDAQRRASARDELQQFQRKVGTTTIYVTHDQVEAMGMGDRIAVMDHGRIRQLGTPREIYDEPADTFVATFLGSPPMNLRRPATASSSASARSTSSCRDPAARRRRPGHVPVPRPPRGVSRRGAPPLRRDRRGQGGRPLPDHRPRRRRTRAPRYDFAVRRRT